MTTNTLTDNNNMCRTAQFLFRVVPWGLRKALVWIKENYGNPPVIITENGYSDHEETLRDNSRVGYHLEYINEMLKGATI
jgi:beta-glucosidase/6-phospho-beta-glucosidase/beta-galactosidase